MVVNPANFLSVHFEKEMSLYQLSRNSEVVVMCFLFFIKKSAMFFHKYTETGK